MSEKLWEMRKINKQRALLVALTCIGVQTPATTQAASPTGWTSVVVPRGIERQRIQAMPITERPGRLLHIYGNSIRLLNQAPSRVGPPAPLRQIFFGTDRLREETWSTTRSR